MLRHIIADYRALPSTAAYCNALPILHARRQMLRALRRLPRMPVLVPITCYRARSLSTAYSHALP
eukprot:1216252-Alexandrium_andersonii.AAC.1